METLHDGTRSAVRGRPWVTGGKELCVMRQEKTLHVCVAGARVVCGERSWGGGGGGTRRAGVAGVLPCLSVVLGGALGRLAPAWIKVRRWLLRSPCPRAALPPSPARRAHTCCCCGGLALRRRASLAWRTRLTPLIPGEATRGAPTTQVREESWRPAARLFAGHPECVCLSC